MSTKRGKFDFLSEERQLQETEAAPTSEIKNVQHEKSTHAPNKSERRPSGQRIRADLLRDIKILSAEIGRPQYTLIEEALELLLEQYKARKSTS